MPALAGILGARLCAAALVGAVLGWPLAGFARREGATAPRPALVAGASLLTAALVGGAGLSLHALPGICLALGLWTASAVDVACRRIPNQLVGALLLAGCALRLLPGVPGWGAGLLAAAGAGGLFALAALLTREGIGWGDAKLAAAAGWILGPRGAAVTLAVAAVGGGIAAAVLLAGRRRGWPQSLPYAPFFLLGAVCAVLAAV